MNPTPTITIPLSTAEKLTQIAQAMLRLADDMKQQAHPTTGSNPPIVFPDLVKPVSIPEGEEWFWSDEWQAGEKEVNQAFREGRYKSFSSMDDLLADLQQVV